LRDDESNTNEQENASEAQNLKPYDILSLAGASNHNLSIMPALPRRDSHFEKAFVRPQTDVSALLSLFSLES